MHKAWALCGAPLLLLPLKGSWVASVEKAVRERAACCVRPVQSASKPDGL